MAGWHQVRYEFLHTISIERHIRPALLRRPQCWSKHRHRHTRPSVSASVAPSVSPSQVPSAYLTLWLPALLHPSPPAHPQQHPAPCRWARAEVLSQHRVRWVSISVRAEGIRALRAALCRYEGSFVANRVTGAGRYDWPAERATYEGEVADGCKHGFGRLSFADVPIVYEGQWANGQRHGEVRVLLPLGGAVTCVTRHARGYRRGCSSHPTPFHSTGAEEADAAVRHLCRASWCTTPKARRTTRASGRTA